MFSQIILPAIFILIAVLFLIFWLWVFFWMIRGILRAIIKVVPYTPLAAVFIFRLVRNTPHAAVVTFQFIRTYPSVLVLAASNLLPLLGVFFFKWDVFSLLVLYWLESAVVGFYNVLKLQKAAAPSTPEEINELRGYRMGLHSPADLEGKKLARFFIKHYGVFMAFHALFLGIFIFALTSSKFYAPPPLAPATVISFFGYIAALFTSHGISYAINFIGKQEFLSISPAGQLMRPYRRIGVMHLTIIFGAWFAFPFGSTAAFLIVLVLSKIALDIFYHLKERGALPLWLTKGSRDRMVIAGVFKFRRSKNNITIS